MEPAVFCLPEWLDEAFVGAFAARLARVEEASAVVLQGVPGRFCLGMDFPAVSAGGSDHQRLRNALGGFARCLALLMTAPRPTLAVVDGSALGGGLGLAAACDVVLASERARFGLPEALYGLAPAIIRPALLSRLSPQRVNLLLFTCHSRSAEDAVALGLVDRVVAVPELAAAQRHMLRQLRRARSETVAVARRWHTDAVESGLRAAIEDTASALIDTHVLAALRQASAEGEDRR
jgi:enoyl-CoA hydratase/carnithine racemase